MTRDVVIIGGGIAGLSAAWRLRHRDVLLLEAGDRLGGRMRSDVRGDYWLNYGAHLFPAPGSLVDGMARDCGLETVPVTGGMMGLAVGDTLLNSGRVESYPFRLPLSVARPDRLRQAGVKVQLAVRRYHRAENRYAFEDDRTFGEFLGPLSPAVHEIFACAAHRATAELDELSAGCGIGLFALVWGGKGSLIARNLLGGTGQLPAALGRELGERARTNARVDAIRPEGADLVVVSGGEEIRAREVIVACPGPVRGAARGARRRAGRERARAAHLRRLPQRRRRDERDDRDALRRRLRDGHARPRVRHVHQPGARAAHRPAAARRQPDAVRRRPAPPPR